MTRFRCIGIDCLIWDSTTRHICVTEADGGVVEHRPDGDVFIPDEPDESRDSLLPYFGPSDEDEWGVV